MTDEDNHLVDSGEMEDLSEEQSKFKFNLGCLELVTLILDLLAHFCHVAAAFRILEPMLIIQIFLNSCRDNFGLGKPDLGQYGLRRAYTRCFSFLPVSLSRLI